MSSAAIITSIIVLLAGLVCYAFIAQTIMQKRQQRERLLVALQTRVRNFKFMLSEFPAGFLPKELTLLVQRSLMQLLEQMTKLEPSNSSHQKDLQAIAQQVAEAQRQSPASGNPPVAIESSQKAREIKAYLEELYKFVFFLEDKKNLSQAQADIYRRMIRQLVVQLSVDAYVLHGRMARDKGKLRLAIHYLDLALKLMIRERVSGQFDARIAQVRTTIKDLQSLLTHEEGEIKELLEEDSEQAAISNEWDTFAQEPSWKKKQIYD